MIRLQSFFVSCKLAEISEHTFPQQKLLALAILVAFVACSFPPVRAEFTPPSNEEWLGSGGKIGIFTTDLSEHSITAGFQFRPITPQIKFKSNSTSSIYLRNCVADFRLLRVEKNGTLTQTDHTSFTFSREQEWRVLGIGNIRLPVRLSIRCRVMEHYGWICCR